MVALYSKAIEGVTLSRGFLLGIYMFTGSVGVLIIDGVGGRLYAIGKRDPFLMCLGCLCLASIYIVCLAMCRQLHI